MAYDVNLISKVLVKKKLVALVQGVWLFPIVLTALLFFLTALEISGSSIGIYHSILYGSSEDRNLLANKPRSIRSDEWVVNSQITIAQANNNFETVNQNLGNGIDTSVIVDVPHDGVFQLFRPHNLVFFVLPFDNAFAFKWWVMGYLLILSTYFFILALLPKRVLFAVLMSLAMFFSPFIQWWYQYITLAPIYYSLFAGTLLIHILRQTKKIRILLLSTLLTYVLTCFALVQYPAFQIPAAIAVGLFGVGYLVEQYKSKLPHFRFKSFSIIIAILLSGLLVLTFLNAKKDIVNTIQDTAYPGARVVGSGGFSISHLLSGSLSFPLQSNSMAEKYRLPKVGTLNQSEASNFILLLPFLLLPTIYILYQSRKNKTKFVDYPLLLIISGFIGALVWLTVPSLDIIGKLTFLSMVPHRRLLLGIGILNLLFIVFFVRLYQSTEFKFTKRSSAEISFLILLSIIVLHYHFVTTAPGFIGEKVALILAIPIPLITYLFMRKHFAWAALGFLAFSIFSTFLIHPLYKGTDILRSTQLSQEIKTLGENSDKRWIMEDSTLQSFAFMNGEPSLTGIYTYPQLSLWDELSNNKKQEDIYNRYAHVNFSLDRNIDKEISTSFIGATPDHFGIATEPCGSFLKKNNVGFIATSLPIPQTESCLEIEKRVDYPAVSFYIYRILDK